MLQLFGQTFREQKVVALRGGIVAPSRDSGETDDGRHEHDSAVPATLHELAVVVRQDQGCASVEMQRVQLGFEIVDEEVVVERKTGVVDQKPYLEPYCRRRAALGNRLV